MPSRLTWNRRLPYVAMTAVSVTVARRETFTIGGKHFVVLFDDAMISMRYARNLADGHGLVYNVGQHPVEGYTNPLWTVWMAILHLAPVPERLVSTLVIVSGFAILFANLAVIARVTDRLAGENSLATPVVLWTTALCMPVVLWTIVGMEVGLVTLFISASVLECLRWHERGDRRDLYWLAGLLGMSTLIRPDAAVVAAVVAIYAGALTPHRTRRFALVVLLGTVGAVLIAQTVARQAYYGQLFPNTYYLKVTAIHLRTRLKRGGLHVISSTIHALYVPGLLALVWLATARRRAHPATYLLLAIVVAQFGYSVYVGGDSYDGGTASSRYLAVVLPPLLILAALGLDALIAMPRRTRLWAAGTATISLGAVAALRAADIQPGAGTQLGRTPPGTMFWRVAPPIGLLAVVWWAILALDRRAGDEGPSRAERHRGSPLAAVGLAVAVILAFTAQDVDQVELHPLPSAQFDLYATRLAVALRDATDEHATIATGADGEIGYFSHRQIVDILGYTDRRIAHLAPATDVYIPGHDKWDLGYSIGRLQPDVVMGTLLYETAQDRDRILSYGYERLGQQFYVRRASNHVNRAALAEVAKLTGG